MQLVNLTPHAISFVDESGAVLRTIEPSGTLARVSTNTITVGEVDCLPITATEFGEVQGLPEPREDTIYLVSSLVAQRVPGRRDVFIPNESVRDERGRIIGCRSLGQINPGYELIEYELASPVKLGGFFTVDAARAAAEKGFRDYPDNSRVFAVQTADGKLVERFYFVEVWDDDPEWHAELHLC